jgi:hypothetical protein
MYKSGEDRNERALEAVLEAEIALQEAIEFGGLVLYCAYFAVMLCFVICSAIYCRI